MTLNPSFELNNIVTHTQEVELSFAPGRPFKFRKADLLFDSWCQDNYESVSAFFALIFETTTSPETVDGKRLIIAVSRAFYHLISRDDQIFIRDSLFVENQIDEEGNEVKFSIIEKIVARSNVEDVTRIISALFNAKGLSSPNVDPEKKKKTSTDLKKKKRGK